MAYKGLGLAYHCGNPRCENVILLAPGHPRPVVCDLCGGEIGWTKAKTKQTVKVCPTCHTHYAEEANFCSYHLPRVALTKREIRR